MQYLFLIIFISLLNLQQIEAILCYRERRYTGEAAVVYCNPVVSLCAKYEYGDGTMERSCDIGDCRGAGEFTMPAYRVYCCSGNRCNNSSKTTIPFILIAVLTLIRL